MPQEARLNKLETTKEVGPLVDNHWADIRHAKERGQKTAWCMSLLVPFAYAMGIKSHMHAGYAALVGGRKQTDLFLDEAEEVDGQLPDTCSYHRLHMGLASLLLRNKGDTIPESVSLPIPDMLLLARACPEHSHQSDSLYRRFKAAGIDIPMIALDVATVHAPVGDNSDDMNRSIRFMQAQLHNEVIPALERVCGRKFDYDKLSEILAIVKRTSVLKDECMELMKHKPAPATIFDMSVSMAPIMYMMGQPGTEDYYRKLLAEIKDRVANGVPGILPEEKYRVYWDGFMLWGWVGATARKLLKYNANALLGRYAPMECFPHSEHLDPNDPVDSLCEYILRWGNGSATIDAARANIFRWVEEYQMDALIMHSSRTCRLFNIGQHDIVEEVERKYGVPGLILEADMLDKKFYSDAQIDNRLQALFEMVEARKKLRAS